MHVALFAQNNFPEGNMEVPRIKSLARALKAKGLEPSILLSFPNAFNHTFLNHEKSGHWEDIPFQYFSFSTRYFPNVFWKIGLFLSYFIRSTLFFLFRHKTFQIFYLYNPSITNHLHILWLCKIFQKKVVCDLVELMSTESNNAVHKWEEKKIAQWGQHHFAISNKLKDHYQNILEAKNVVKSTIMVDLEEFTMAKHTQNKFTLAYLGSFHSKDQVPLILEAFEQAKQKIKSLQLLLIGYCPWEKELQSKINHKDVIYSGRLPRIDIPKWLSKADTFLLCRKKDKFSEYGYPIKLGEYLAMGQPVILSDLPEYHALFQNEKNCLFFQPNALKSLVDRIIWRYQNTNKSQTIGLEGQKIASNYFKEQKVAHEMAEQIVLWGAGS